MFVPLMFQEDVKRWTAHRRLYLGYPKLVRFSRFPLAAPQDFSPTPLLICTKQYFGCDVLPGNRRLLEEAVVPPKKGQGVPFFAREQAKELAAMRPELHGNAQAYSSAERDELARRIRIAHLATTAKDPRKLLRNAIEYHLGQAWDADELYLALNACCKENGVPNFYALTLGKFFVNAVMPPDSAERSLIPAAEWRDAQPLLERFTPFWTDALIAVRQGKVPSMWMEFMDHVLWVFERSADGRGSAHSVLSHYSHGDPQWSAARPRSCAQTCLPP